MGFAILSTFIWGIEFCNNADDVPSDAKSDPFYKPAIERLRKIKQKLKISFSLFILFLFLSIIVPSTKQAYLIFGIGGTIDYLKDNETAKQLPDKAVIALDKWLDSVSDTTKVK